MPEQLPFRFGGFTSPTYTQTPDQFFDQLMQHLSEAELRVCLYVMRRTFGFKKDSDAISINQMVNGITTRDGRVLDQGCGLGRTAVKRGVQGLVEKNVLTVTKTQSENGEYETNIYSLVVRSGVGREETHPKVGVGHETTHPRSPSDPRVGREGTLQETVQQTDSQERPVEDSKIREVNRSIVDKYDDARLSLLPYAEDLARELNDQAPLASTTTRLVNLYKRTGMSIDDFIEQIMIARAITKERTASIKAAPTGNGFGRKPKIGYFFSILEDITGQKSRSAD